MRKKYCDAVTHGIHQFQKRHLIIFRSKKYIDILLHKYFLYGIVSFEFAIPFILLYEENSIKHK
jgi:hypothetical protein